MLIAWKNIIARKWSSAKVVLSIFAMVVIMCIFTAYSLALADESERIIQSYRSAHNITINTTQPMSEDKLREAAAITGVDYVTEVATCRNVENLMGMTFYVDGKSYHCEHDYYEGNMNIGIDEYVNALHYGNFAFIQPNTNLSTPHHNAELNYRFKGNNSVLVGRDFVRDNEIIVSEYFLEDLGLTSSIVGKDMRISFDGQNFTFKVVGVMNKCFYQLTDTLNQHFICSVNSDLFTRYFANKKPGNTNYYTRLYIAGYKLDDRLINEVKNLHLFYAKNIYLGSEYGISMSTTVSIISSILNGVMATVGLGIISALVLNIMYSMHFMMKKKNNFYAIMQVYGMDRKKLFEILFSEMFILSMISAVLAYAISYGLVYLLDYLLSTMVGVGVFFSWSNFLITFAIAVVFTLCMVVAVCVVNYLLYFKQSMSKKLRNSMLS